MYMGISKGKLYEIHEVDAPFFAREYFIRWEKGEEMSILELVDFIHNHLLPENREVIKTTIYSTMIEIAKQVYEDYE